MDAATNTVRIEVWNGVEERFGVPIPVPKPTEIRRIWDCVRAADLVHVHDVMYFTSFCAVAFAKLLRKPAMVTLHIWKVPYKSAVVRGLQQIAHCSLGSFCLRSASAVVTYNRCIFELARKWLDEDRVHFIPNGISKDFVKCELDVAAESQANLRSRLGLPLNTRIAIFAGRFVEKKGLSHIHGLAERFPDVLFLFCGTGPADPAEWGCPNVKVLGQKTAPQLQQLFHASDVLLLPSVGEGFPMVIQEAMSCGLPCLILEETWASWGRDRDYYIVADCESIDNSFGSYLSNPFSIAFRRRIREFSLATWDWRNSAAQYQRIYESVLGVKPLQRAACSDAIE
jgi:glycosyltransferase involved in cell wall biosynthesis